MFSCIKYYERDGNMKIELRKCNYNDLEFILELKRLTMKWYIEKIYGWDENIQRKKTQEELNNNIEDMRIIMCEGKDIGVTTFNNFEDCYQVGLIIVHPSYQNKGIATKIINEYIKIAKENNKKIVIKTYKENPARILYQRLGFEICKTDDTHIHFQICNK